jgi:hypothetical protein
MSCRALDFIVAGTLSMMSVQSRLNVPLTTGNGLEYNQFINQTTD